MARHGVSYMLIYRKPAYIEHVCKLFHFVRTKIVVDPRTSAIKWIYTYLNSDYTSYELFYNGCIFTNGNMTITVTRDSIAYIPNPKGILLLFKNAGIELIGVSLTATDKCQSLRKELLYIAELAGISEPITCYWLMVETARRHNLVSRLAEL